VAGARLGSTIRIGTDPAGLEDEVVAVHGGADALDVAGVSHRYGATRALSDVDLTVAAGECVALLGPNGAGKTTLVNLVTGLLTRQAGTVRVVGDDPARAATRRALGVVQ
jgi:ABC-2 type transport system ATP-binding protein